MADQNQFSAALLDPDLPVPEGIIRPDGQPASKRFDVYRNNVVASLVSAMGEAFPVCKRLVGDAFFDAVALNYVRANPPRSPLIMFYGAEFSDFLANFEPAQQVPYLPDVARLEHARRVAFHAADDKVMDPQDFANVPPEKIAEISMVFHASVRIIPSAFPIFSIWRFNSTDDTTPIAQNAEDVLVTRPAAEVLMQRLPAGGAAFIGALSNGKTLSDAADIASIAAPTFDLSENIGALLSAGALTNISVS